MANIFEQYQQAEALGSPSTASVYTQGYTTPAEQLQEQVASTGFIEARRHDETPIFKRQLINFKPPSQIVGIDLSANGTMLVLALADSTVCFVDLANPDDILRVTVTRRTDEKVHKIFIDTNGRHLVVAMESGDSYYIPPFNRKPKVLPKFKGTIVESIAWNRTQCTDQTTREILVGSSRGGIFETEIAVQEGKFFENPPEKYFKQLYTLNDEPVTGLMFEQFSEISSAGEKKFFIMATTPSRLYQFVGHVTTAEPPLFQWLFNTYDSSPPKFLEVPGSLTYSHLQVWPRNSAPRTFAWLTEPGVYYGQLNLRNQGPHDSVTLNCRLLRSPTQTDKDRPMCPVAIALTEFHALLLFRDRFEAICVLNDEVVFEERINMRQVGAMKGMVYDARRGPWSHAEMHLYKYKVTRESRDVWKIYLNQGDYKKAKEHAQSDPVQMDHVLTSQAEHLFEQKQYTESAGLFAVTQKSFEEVALKFMRIQQSDSLKTFLQKKLDSLKREDKTQQTMLVTWIIEIYLTKLGELKDSESSAEEVLRVQDQFRQFLKSTRVKLCLEQNRHAVYELIDSHGDVEDLVFVAMLLQDFERVISHCLQQQDYSAALEVLTKKQSDSKLFYKFSPILIKHTPVALVDSWISLGAQLDARKLIPALTHYEPTNPNAHQAIRYLEFCVQVLKNRDAAIHNYLLSLYAKLDDDTQLLQFLNQGQRDEPCFDMKYALRLCADHGRAQACVYLYCTMGLYEEAVDLALKVNVDLARLMANKPDETDEALRKKLWLKIARHVVEQEDDIKKAIRFLPECPLLKIEDILPFFPDFVTIEDFKEAICNALQEYNEHIETLKGDMQDATKSAQSIRADIQDMRNKYGIVSGKETCSLCSYPLLTRSFYIFPCQHVFHSDCLVSEVSLHLNRKQKSRLADLQQRVQAESQTEEAADESTTVVSKSEQLKSELDDMVAADCVLCGKIMIQSIDKPFIDPAEYDDIVRSWL